MDVAPASQAKISRAFSRQSSLLNIHHHPRRVDRRVAQWSAANDNFEWASIESRAYVFNDFVDGEVVWKDLFAWVVGIGAFRADVSLEFDQMLHNAGTVGVVLKRRDAHRRLIIQVPALWVGFVRAIGVISTRQKHLEAPVYDK